MAREIRELTEPDELRRSYDVMRELRDHLSRDEYLEG